MINPSRNMNYHIRKTVSGRSNRLSLLPGWPGRDGAGAGNKVRLRVAEHLAVLRDWRGRVGELRGQCDMIC